MRLLAICSCFLLVTSTLPAQRFPDIENVKTRLMKFDSSRFDNSHVIPFRDIEIIDFRFDTSKIGYYGYHDGRRHEQLLFAGGVQLALNKKLNQYFKNNLDISSTAILVIVIKNLWLQYGSTNGMLRSKTLPPGSPLYKLNQNAVCLADLDVFVKTDTTYRALARINSSFIIDKVGQRSDQQLLLLPFDSVMQKINSLNVDQTLTTKKKFSAADIRRGYERRFAIPVLSASRDSRGVYLSFDDFRNNKKSFPDFQIKNSAYSTDVIVNRDGNEIIVSDYWGFFDGKDFYIKPGLLPFRAVRKGNTFDLFGSIESDDKNFLISLPGGGRIAIPQSLVPAYPLQVNMETGKVY